MLTITDVINQNAKAVIPTKPAQQKRKAKPCDVT